MYYSDNKMFNVIFCYFIQIPNAINLPMTTPITPVGANTGNSR